MSARGIPARSQGPPAKRVPSVIRCDPQNPPQAKLQSLPGFKHPSRNQQMAMAVFDPEAFLARAGLGKKILNLKKNEVAFAQGDPADAIFYVQKGRLRVTVTSANGKEATITLVGAGEFLGENCMVSAHPLRLATATAMTECALLRISKAEMVRVLHQEPELSDDVRLLSAYPQRSHPGRSGRSAFQFQRKAAGEDSVTARAVRQGKQTRDGGS